MSDTVFYKIDHMKVDNALEEFPVDIFMTSNAIPVVLFNSFFTNDTFKPTEFKVINPENSFELYTEISYYNYSAKEMMIHVKVPYIYPDKDTYVEIVPTTTGTNLYVGETNEYVINTTISGDDFNLGTAVPLDSDLWTVIPYGSGSTEIFDNKARVIIPLSTSDKSADMEFNYNITGDFDVQVDYDEVYKDPPSSSYSYPASLRLTFGSKRVQIGTMWTSSSDSMLVNSVPTNPFVSCTPHYATGKLRISRVGSVFKAYYWTGSQWEWNGNVSGYQFADEGTEDAQISLPSTATFSGACTVDYDNLIIIGDIPVYPAKHVWDSDYAAVYHMTQDPSGGTDCMLDSTSNQKHANPIGGMLSVDLVDTDFGKGIEFNTLDRFIQIPDGVWDNIVSTATISMKYVSGDGRVLGKGGSGESIETNQLRIDWQSDAVYHIFERSSSGIDYTFGPYALEDNPRDSNWNTTVIFIDITEFRAGINGQFISLVDTVYNTDTTAGTAIGPAYSSLPIRTYSTFFGVVRDVRISSIVRDDTWEKVTSYSLNNDLIEVVYPMTCEGTVGDQFTSLSGININLYRRIDGSLVGNTTSTSSGTFSIGSIYVEDHYIVALYSNSSLNALIYDYISPTYSGS